MSSVIWYLYEFAKKSWIDKFTTAKSHKEIMDKPDRFRDFPKVTRENCISCGACTAACPVPKAIKLIRDTDTDTEIGLTYPEIDNSTCIRCGFCSEVCPSEPKTITCGENHEIREEFQIIPTSIRYVIDDYLCIRCKKCKKVCPVDAIEEQDNKLSVNQKKCIHCGKCAEICPVKGSLKTIYVNHLEEQKKVIKLITDSLEKIVEDNEYQFMDLDKNSTFRMQIPIKPLKDKCLKIINIDDLVQDLLEKMTDRLNLRVITWDMSKCNNCRLCVDECPSKAITYNKNDGVQRNVDKCLRCSVCYQTCPFDVVRYYHVRFLIEDEIIVITVQTSQLARN